MVIVYILNLIIPQMSILIITDQANIVLLPLIPDHFRMIMCQLLHNIISTFESMHINLMLNIHQVIFFPLSHILSPNVD